jgi:hypothetical protein
MRELDFNSLRERLLREGVAPKHVRRTIAELQDHHTDLFAEAFSRGCTLEEAGIEASVRLGDEDTLAAEIIARPELKSWAHRLPWVAYCVIPPVLFVAGFIGAFLLLGLSVQVDRYSFARHWGSPDTSRSLVGAIRLVSMFGLPLFLAGACCFLAARRRAAVRWPVLGVIMMSIIGGASRLDACWPHGPDVPGAVCLGLSVPPFPNSAITIVRAVGLCFLTLGPLLWWRRRTARLWPSHTP